MSVKKQIVRREVDAAGLANLEEKGLDSLLPSIYAARGVKSIDQIRYTLKNLISFEALKGVKQASEKIVEMAEQQKSIVVIGDFDTDGATAVAVMMLAMRQFDFKNINFVVPNRFEHGYGLSPEIIDLAVERYQPALIITVDSGMKDIEGVAHANRLGIEVIVTDHHMPGDVLPEAAVIVNPNAPDNTEFPSKAMAGVTVAFYVMLGVREVLRQKDWFVIRDMPDPNMAELMDLVALGTIADVVPLDQNNRIIVFQGLMRIQKGRGRIALKALFAVAQRNTTDATSSDLGFAIAPHLNAAGRLKDIEVGIQLLITDDPEKADLLAAQLHDLNLERRQIEMGMQKEALDIVKGFKVPVSDLPAGLCLYDPDWHQGIVGILASRMKDQFLRPTIILTRHTEGQLKGSARSISNYDIRAMIADIAQEHPDIVLKHGGHKTAAGLTITEAGFECFKTAFETTAQRVLSAGLPDITIKTDGELPAQRLTLDVARMIREAGPWGQKFTEPSFEGEFNIVEQRIVGQRHLKIGLQPVEGYEIINGIAFNVDLEEWPNETCSRVRLVYRLDVNEYRGMSQLQLIIQYLEPISSAADEETDGAQGGGGTASMGQEERVDFAAV